MILQGLPQHMPLRMLQYAGNLYEKYVKQRKLNKYGSVF